MSRRLTIRPGPPPAAQKGKQMMQLQSQLAQLADQMTQLESLMSITAIQAECMRELGGYSGSLLMAASKVLGEEAINQSGPPVGDETDDRRS